MNCKGYVLLCVACFVCLHLLCRLFLFRKRVVDPRPIEVKLKEHGIIIKEVLPIAEGGDSIICPYSIIDLFPLVSHLRIGLHDVFELLHQPAESSDETSKRSKMLQIIESILQEQETILATEIDLEMSKYWAVNESSTADPNLSAPVNYDLPQLPRDYFKDLIREEPLSSQLAEQEFTERLNQTIQNHRIDSIETIKRIFNSINGGRLPWEIFAPEYLEDYISKDDAQYREWFYDRSIFKTYPNETLSLLSLGAPMIKGVESRPSKYQLLLHICHPTYYARKKENQQLYRIETEPQLVDDYYAQPILPELIAIEDGHLDTAKTISNWGMMGQHKSFFLHDGKYVGKMEELPSDCNVKAKTGCQFILTPKNKFEAENPEKVAEMRAAQSEASLNLTLKGDL